MPAVVTFDGTTRTIIEIDNGAINLTKVAEIYSEWKVWVKDGGGHSFPKAFNSSGGEDTSEGDTSPKYFFLINDWKLRPFESDHYWELTESNIFADDGSDIFIDTIGAFTVRTRTNNSEVPTKAVGSGVTAQDKTDIIDGVLAGEIDANIIKVTDTPVTGDGSDLDPWGP